ncbi:MAG: EamA family transporter [Anaerolineales bacterium]|nr:EamA family transporter [Anaerolineales bacterium]
MTFTQLLWILGSAVVHVVAHVALRTTGNRNAFVWWILAWGGVLFLPVALWRWQPIAPAVWAIMAISAVFEAGYFLSIARAYQDGDLSIVYPLARGTAPVLLLVWSSTFLSERLTWGGVAGVVTIALGLYVINLPRLGAWRAPLAALRRPGPRWALLAGLCISLYTAVDRVGIRFLDPFLYTYLALWLTLLFITPVVVGELGWRRLGRELRASSWRSALSGMTTLLAYAIVLYVMHSGAPAGYTGATREVSVVFGVLIGVFVLKEPGTVPRLAGAVLVALGVAGIKLLG